MNTPNNKPIKLTNYLIQAQSAEEATKLKCQTCNGFWYYFVDNSVQVTCSDCLGSKEAKLPQHKD